jgi:hypothetical protein
VFPEQPIGHEFATDESMQCTKQQCVVVAVLQAVGDSSSSSSSSRISFGWVLQLQSRRHSAKAWLLYGWEFCAFVQRQ